MNKVQTLKIDLHLMQKNDTSDKWVKNVKICINANRDKNYLLLIKVRFLMNLTFVFEIP